MRSQLFVQFLTLLLALGLAGLEASKQQAAAKVAATATDDVNNLANDAANAMSAGAAAAKDDLSMSLRFEPPELDFGLWSIGIARSHQVTLVNENVNHSVHLSSVSGGTSIFFASFMETRVIAPLSNTTFDVVFLPRKSVLATDTLLVHTSFGQARLLVRGRGFECPYRLKPLVGIKAPLNAMLTPEIYMYNPHERPLQIIEIYSSGGQFQLELPSGLSSAPQALWEIPPYTTKPIIRIKFHGNSAGNHSAFIRIKIAAQPTTTTTNVGDDDEVGGMGDGVSSSSQSHLNMETDVLVVPVEIEIVGEYGGVYASNPVLDFGRLTNAKPKRPIQLKMNLKNSNEAFDTTADPEATTHAADERTFNVFPKSTLPLGLKFQANDGGSLILDAFAFNKTTIIDELITMQSKYEDSSKQGNFFTIRVRAEIFKGTLHFDRNVSVFVGDAAANHQTRTLSVRNDFEEPLALQNVSYDNYSNQKAVHFELGKDFSERMLQPGQSYELLHLHLKDNRTQYHSSVRIQTNVTNFELPVIVCTGRLHVTTHNEPLLEPQAQALLYNTELNMGAVPLEEKSQDGFIALHNPNPVGVRIVNWNFKSPQGVYFETTSLGCLRPAALAALQANKTVAIEGANFHFCAGLEENDVMIFRIAIQSHVTDLQTASLQIWTTYETITASVRFYTWVGKLEVEQEELYFKNCFPGKLCSSDLSIRSTFQYPIHITAINFTDDSIRFPSDDNGKKLVFALTPNAVTRLGRIYFEPALHCHKRCYLPQDEKLNSLAFPKTSSASTTTTTTTTTTTLANNNFHFDEAELRRRTDLYRQMKRHFRTINFMLTSRELRQVQLQAIVDIKWPKLVLDGAQKMSTIEAGKFQEHTVIVRNPADRPILVDYFLSNPKFAPETKLSLPVEVVDMSSTPSCYLTDQHVFTLKQPLQEQQQILLPPQSSVGVVVRFDAPPQLTDTFCTLLHIRNNLTLYEAVWLSAKSVQSQFRFGNRKPGTPTPLIFEVLEKHLAACQQQQPVIVKRTFTARNTGEVPIRIESFMIGDQMCEGYGFKVIGCGKGGGFELKANESRKVEILFRPDFALFRITQTLTILSNLSYEINYTLFAQLPPAEMLRDCIDSQPRPMWEQHIRIAGVLLLLTSFVLVLAAATVDADNIGNTQSALYAAREKGAIQPTFNLRNIAIKATSQQQQHQQSQSSNKNCKINNNSASNANGNHSHHHQQQQRHKTQHSSNPPNKTARRRAAIGNQSNQRKSSASTESTNADVQDEKFTFDFDVAGWQQQQHDYSASGGSSSSNSSSFKSSPSPPKSTATVDKKPKILTSAASGKTKNSNRNHQQRKSATSTTTTPPLKRNPIIELMDKDIDKENGQFENKAKVGEPTLLKRLTETIAAAAVSIKEKSKPNKSEDKKKAESNSPSPAPTASKVLENATNEAIAERKNMQREQKPSAATPINNVKQQHGLADAGGAAVQSSMKSANYVGPIRNMESYQSQKATATPTPTPTPTQKAENLAESAKVVETKSNQVESKNSVNAENGNEKQTKALAFTATENQVAMPAPAAAKPLNVAASNAQTLPVKYGKTPGRERSCSRDNKTSNQNSNSAHFNGFTLPKQTKVIKTLNFDEATNFGCANFKSHQLAAHQHPNHNLEQQTPKSTFGGSEQAALYLDLKAKQDLMSNVIGTNFATNAAATLPPLSLPLEDDKAANSMAKSISNIFKDQSSTQQQQQQAKVAELGPIGTKKSPSSTPIWEPIAGANMRAPLQPKVMSGGCNNNTFFSYPPTSSATSQSLETENSLQSIVGNQRHVANLIDPNAAQAILGNVTASSFLELKKAQADLQRRMEANEILLSLHQMEKERRQRQQQQDFLHSMTQQWSTNVAAAATATTTTQAARNAWPASLMGYAAPAGNSGANNNAAMLAFNENAARKNSLTPPTCDQYDAWATTATSTASALNKSNATTIRPPPGLGVAAVTTPPGLALQQQQQQIFHANNNSNNNLLNDCNDNGLLLSRAFDPFSSLGSIWPDSWVPQTGNNQQQQQQQQQPPPK